MLEYSRIGGYNQSKDRDARGMKETIRQETERRTGFMQLCWYLVDGVNGVLARDFTGKHSSNKVNQIPRYLRRVVYEDVKKLSGYLVGR